MGDFFIDRVFGVDLPCNISVSILSNWSQPALGFERRVGHLFILFLEFIGVGAWFRRQEYRIAIVLNLKHSLACALIGEHYYQKSGNSI